MKQILGGISMGNIFTTAAQSFIDFTNAAGTTFLDMVKGSIPALIIMLTLINFIVKIVGEDKIEKFSKILAKSRFLTYGILPSLAWFFLSSPGALTIGRFLPEKAKPGFEDALGATAHPLTSLFPHVVPAELFIWLGIANGVEALGLPIHNLAIRYLLAGILVGLIRGYVTEFIFLYLQRKKHMAIEKQTN